MQATRSGFVQHSSQHGSAMIVSLAILAMLTVAAAVSMQRTTLQVKMVGNMQQKHAVSSILNSNSSYFIGLANSDDNPDSELLSNELTKFISQNKVSLSKGNSAGSLSVSLYDVLNWDYLSFPNMKTAVTITDTTIIEKSVDRSSGSMSLKNIAGSSEGSRYYMRSTYVGTDEHGNTVTVEQGFYIDGS